MLFFNKIKRAYGILFRRMVTIEIDIDDDLRFKLEQLYKKESPDISFDIWLGKIVSEYIKDIEER